MRLVISWAWEFARVVQFSAVHQGSLYSSGRNSSITKCVDAGPVLSSSLSALQIAFFCFAFTWFVHAISIWRPSYLSGLKLAAALFSLIASDLIYHIYIYQKETMKLCIEYANWMPLAFGCLWLSGRWRWREMERDWQSHIVRFLGAQEVTLVTLVTLLRF